MRRAIAEALRAGTPLRETGPAGVDGSRCEYVTFLYEDAHADEVLLFVNRLTDESRLQDSLMRRLPGTDVWHLGYLMAATWRASYCFLPVPQGRPAPWSAVSDQVGVRAALDRGVPDPRNPERCPARGGRELSVVSLAEAGVSPWPVRPDPEAPVPQWLSAPADHRVLVESCGVAPGEGASTAPVVVLFDGEVWWEQGVVGAVRAAVAAGALAPVHLVLLDSGGTRKRWVELDGTGGIEDYLADELLPWVAQRAGVCLEPQRVATAGQSLGGLSAILCTLRRPDAVAGAVAQSSSLWQPYPEDELRALVEADGARALERTRIVMEVGEQEWVLTGPHDHFAEQLRQTPASLRYRRFNGGHDYACWREGLVPALVELFPGPHGPDHAATTPPGRPGTAVSRASTPVGDLPRTR